MKQLNIFINHLVTFANVAIAHLSITPGTKPNELVYATIRVLPDQERHSQNPF